MRSRSVCARDEDSGPSAAPVVTSGPLTKVTVAYDNIGALYLPLWIALDAGIFASQGPDVSIQPLSTSGSLSTAALIAGQIDINQSGGASIIATNAGGADLVGIATMAPVYPYKLEDNCRGLKRLDSSSIRLATYRARERQRS